MDMQGWHWHSSTSSRDCDGPFYTRSDYFPQGDEPAIAGRPGWAAADFTLFELALATVASVAYQSVITVEPWYDDDDEELRGGWDINGTYTHDEGFHSQSIRVCNDPRCVPEPSWQRDVYAESMGY